MPRKGYRKPDLPREISLASGGRISLSLSNVDLYALSVADRAFVFAVIDLFVAYSKKPEKAEEPKSPGVAVTLSRVT
jgi:hypothetical protein